MKRKLDTGGIILIAIMLIAVLLIYFSWNKSSGTGIAVVDIDRVVRTLGRDVGMQEAMRRKELAIDEQFKNLKASLDAKHAEKKAEIGDAPTAEQTEELRMLENTLNVQANEALRLGQQELVFYREQLNNEVRREISPIADKVASQQNASIVILRNPNFLLSHGQSEDITDKLIAHMRAKADPSPAAGP